MAENEIKTQVELKEWTKDIPVSELSILVYCRGMPVSNQQEAFNAFLRELFNKLKEENDREKSGK